LLADPLVVAVHDAQGVSNLFGGAEDGDAGLFHFDDICLSKLLSRPSNMVAEKTTIKNRGRAVALLLSKIFKTFTQ
jgi:hypothetical protein